MDRKITVENGGLILQLTVSWPSVMLNMNAFHAQWLQPRSKKSILFTKFHPRFLAFEKALRGLREHVTDSIDSTVYFTLPFPVETHIHENTALLHLDSNSKIFCVTVRAYAESYKVVNNGTDFPVI